MKECAADPNTHDDGLDATSNLVAKTMLRLMSLRLKVPVNVFLYCQKSILQEMMNNNIDLSILWLSKSILIVAYFDVMNQ